MLEVGWSVPLSGGGASVGKCLEAQAAAPQHVKDAIRIWKALELSQMSDCSSDGLQTQPPWDLAEG